MAVQIIRNNDANILADANCVQVFGLVMPGAALREAGWLYDEDGLTDGWLLNEPQIFYYADNHRLDNAEAVILKVNPSDAIDYSHADWDSLEHEFMFYAALNQFYSYGNRRDIWNEFLNAIISYESERNEFKPFVFTHSIPARLTIMRA